jgi:thiamine kinase-like enzyme
MLPMSMQDVTTQWLSSVLSNSARSVSVESFAVLDTIHGTATKVRLALQYRNGSDVLPNIMWLKAGFEPDHAFLAGQLGLHAMEVDAYQHLLPSLSIVRPECFYACSQAEPAQGVLLLEDLRLRDVRFNAAHIPLNFSESCEAVKALANLHRQYWGSNVSKIALQLPAAMTGAPLQVLSLYIADIGKLLDQDRVTAAVRTQHTSKRLAAALDAYKRYAKSEEICLLHGDAHTGNTYMNPDGALGFLDWQLACVGNWAHDLSYFLGSALSIEDRRQYEKELLRLYLSELQESGVVAPNWDRAWEAYRRAFFYGFMIWLGNDDMWQAPEINQLGFERFCAAVDDHQTYTALGV